LATLATGTGRCAPGPTSCRGANPAADTPAAETPATGQAIGPIGLGLGGSTGGGGGATRGSTTFTTANQPATAVTASNASARGQPPPPRRRRARCRGPGEPLWCGGLLPPRGMRYVFVSRMP
jgi:hypothetical protein